MSPLGLTASPVLPWWASEVGIEGCYKETISVNQGFFTKAILFWIYKKPESVSQLRAFYYLERDLNENVLFPKFCYLLSGIPSLALFAT